MKQRTLAPAAMIEGLEDRRLLSVSLSNGVLTITGTNSADQIEVKRAQAGSSTLKVEVKTGSAKTERTFALSAVNKIVVRGLGGNDTIEISESNGTINRATDLSGGDGNDTIQGGSGADLIHGNNGADIIEGKGNNDNIFGDAGNDILSGGNGNDHLTGGDGNDDLQGGAGVDVIFGNAGNDDFDNSDASSEIKDRNAGDNGANTTVRPSSSGGDDHGGHGGGNDDGPGHT
jgi:Ca2+-binding RTX toxin-like protein